eukprot:3921271-Amphidinium_carterae.1
MGRKVSSPPGRKWMHVASVDKLKLKIINLDSFKNLAQALVALSDSKDQREHRFTNSVHQIVRQGGKCLLPVFALGRAQE